MLGYGEENRVTGGGRMQSIRSLMVTVLSCPPRQSLPLQQLRRFLFAKRPVVQIARFNGGPPADFRRRF
jgi:hypothetical protein